METIDPSVELQELKKQLAQLRPKSDQKDSFSATNAYLFGVFFTLGVLTISVLIAIVGFILLGVIGRNFFDYLTEQPATSRVQPTQTVRSTPNPYRR